LIIAAKTSSREGIADVGERIIWQVSIGLRSPGDVPDAQQAGWITG
jgi:hypothetical protein